MHKPNLMYKIRVKLDEFCHKIRVKPYAPKINVKKNKKFVYKSEHICKSCVYSQKQKQFIMEKEQILELLKSKESELYANLQECKSIYGGENNHTRYAAGAWGSIFELLQTIEENENN